MGWILKDIVPHSYMWFSIPIHRSLNGLGLVQTFCTYIFQKAGMNEKRRLEPRMGDFGEVIQKFLSHDSSESTTISKILSWFNFFCFQVSNAWLCVVLRVFSLSKPFFVVSHVKLKWHQLMSWLLMYLKKKENVKTAGCRVY